MKRKLLSQSEFAQRWSELHGGAAIKGAVSGWLKISYRVAKIFSLIRFTPNVLTGMGLFCAIGMIVTSNYWVVLAILQERASKWGALLDSVVDRISEALWLYVGWRLGIPTWLALAMWIVASTQEYARARMASLGMHEVGVVTVTERPVRAIFMAFVLLFKIFNLPGLTILSLIFFAALLFSFAQILRATFLKLH
jgi:CDP-diacylglycerol--glycerol-3-phosphate 3-phosphatidyltransferase